MAEPIESITVRVAGRPAPQGSKHLGEHGQMREASPYVPAWRAAVKRAVYERYRELGVSPDALPLLRGPVGVVIEFRMPTRGRRVDTAPDLDKLERATWDALTQSRVWEDDGRVVYSHATKRAASSEHVAGAWITVVRCPRWAEIEQGCTTS